ncbi:type 1 glutamine amidotransferase [Mucilaginibacter myungsuensis]|uniref:GMP synthase n=1 Tax=Mucilaginibacter myungsuensis TaxID=649104 RepID=A0A929KXJ3_9SPHI|nr:GMP synthase [Mucilaginibacter myungsuensis]MBE9662293.1 GMP synthase [Mucilaginibacter myungsuensis]MDN3599270.1 GMP synthase [Mucilaginibacter myungsuensis]
MTQEAPIKVAILDLYAGMANQGMRGFKDILKRYREKHGLDLEYKVYDTRGANELPDTSYDIYICSGGPGDPLSSEAEDWDINFMKLVGDLEAHNASDATDKKHVFFVCHSFQMMCRRYKLGLINKRRSPSFGILPVHLTDAGKHEPVLQDLSDPFYTVDSRSWQVIHADEKRFTELGMQLLIIEKERPYVDLPRAMMAIRFSDYFIGTQFHPEADAMGMKYHLEQDERKNEVIAEHGKDKYNDMIERLEDPDKIMHTQNTLIPNFLDQAVKNIAKGEMPIAK